MNNEYKVNTELETRKYEADVHTIENTARVSLDFIRLISLLKDSNLWKQILIEEVQEEMVTMLMGKMMAMIEGRRAAEDDEHTEVSALKTCQKRIRS